MNVESKPVIPPIRLFHDTKPPEPPPLPAQGMFLRIEDIARLSEVLGVKIHDRDELLAAAISVRTINVGGVAIELEKGLLSRLRSRCIGNQDFGKWLSAEILKQLHGFVGW